LQLKMGEKLGVKNSKSWEFAETKAEKAPV
jgi:hypothetical protein